MMRGCGACGAGSRTEEAASEIEVIAYEPRMAPQVVASYNEVIRGVPHCYAVSAEELASAVSATAGALKGRRDYARLPLSRPSRPMRLHRYGDRNIARRLH